MAYKYTHIPRYHLQGKKSPFPQASRYCTFACGTSLQLRREIISTGITLKSEPFQPSGVPPSRVPHEDSGENWTVSSIIQMEIVAYDMTSLNPAALMLSIFFDQCFRTAPSDIFGISMIAETEDVRL